MNFEYYKNFITIVDAGNISKAAERLLIAQPALTKQLHIIEENYGAQLVIRHPRNLELTDAGKILYERAKTICYLEDAAQKEISSCVLGNQGTLRLGRTPANPDRFMDQLLFSYHEKFEKVNFEITERNSDDIMEMLEEGLLDVGIVRAHKIISPALRPMLTMKEEIMVCFHKDHPLLRPEYQEISMDLLKQCPISISKGLVSNYSTACEYHGFTANYMTITNSRFLSIAWAEDKKTVTIVVNAKAEDVGDYCYRPIKADFPERVRAFVVPAQRKISRLTEEFVDFCADKLTDYGWEYLD